MLKKSLLTLLVALTFIAGTAKAYSLEDAMADISSLKTQIGDLKSQLSAAVITSKSDTTVSTVRNPEVTPTTNKATITFISPKNITPNAKGEDVITLQTALKDAGYFTAPVTGTYGAVTEKAVKAFQKANNLPTTGVVGNLTKALLIPTIGGQQNGSVSNCTIVLQSMTTPATQNVAIGTTNFNFAKFRAFSGCTMKLNTLKIVVGGTVASNTIASSLTNLKVYVDGIQYGVTVNPVQGQNTITLNGPVFSPNTVKTISLYADVIGGSGLTAKIGISNATGTSTQTGIPVVPYSGAIQYGQMMNIGTGCLPTSIPSVTVLSPNGGEVFTAGQQITVKWTSCNLPPTAQIGVFLEYVPAPVVYNMLGGYNASVPNTGIATITLPSILNWPGLPVSNPVSWGNNYKMYISTNFIFPFQPDLSDNLFTINSTPSLPVGCTSYAGFNSVNGTPCWLITQYTSLPEVTSTTANLYGYLFDGAPATITWSLVPSSPSLPSSYLVTSNGLLSASLAGLTPNTNYQYKVCGLTSAFGQYGCGLTMSFQTLP